MVLLSSSDKFTFKSKLEITLSQSPALPTISSTLFAASVGSSITVPTFGFAVNGFSPSSKSNGKAIPLKAGAL